jgi:hypothetical protein
VFAVKKRPFLHRTGDALSQLGNTLLGRECNHSVCGDAYFYGPRWWEAVWDRLFALIEDHHCYKAHYRDIDRMADRLVEHLTRYPEDVVRFADLKDQMNNTRKAWTSCTQ